ncbi:conserved protein of unknown function [Nitrospira japonica]|uniref:Pyridoxamine 5'-phosphate oxidase N-terminal domain-containing protein n=1 Tax=Nitrospira japonica TaxID=1325564 RepID=A0A1W1HZQ0_9BACT|nr:pyridoxamine 5'-phosphate oxidase family protein [Nitrospira japonica]SLM46202.1 conserved protein of unknown function [Nitrospira japonica]
MSDSIENVAELEACIGKVPGPIDLKVIDHLDDGARRWIAASPLLFAAFGDGRNVGMTLGGGEQGFVQVLDASRLRLPAAALDELQLAREGLGFGALFLTPSIGETLRVGGRVAAVKGGEVEIHVDECYVHCAKALIRSKFWEAPAHHQMPDDAPDFVAASRFMALATVDAKGHADVSPKGDPQDMLIRLRQGCAWIADRPGNRRADSFRNMLTQPHVAAALLIPGCTKVALLSGRARITTDAAVRTDLSVAGKMPILLTCIEQPALSIRESAALTRAGLWPAKPRAEGIDSAAMFVAHIKHSKARGLQAKLARAAVSVPGIMEKGLQRDYRKNLY